jgi:hypothetical protein
MRYILLNVGEIVEDGDEEYIEDELDDVDCPEPSWRPVSVNFIGEYVQEIDPPVRRRIKLSKIPTKG